MQACTGAHAPCGTPERGHDTSEGHTWAERGHRLKSPPCWLRASVSPLVTGHPGPRRCPAPPRGRRHSPVLGCPSPPCTPKSTDRGSVLARSIPVSPAPVQWNWELGSVPILQNWELWSVLLRCPRASSREPVPSGGTRTRATLSPQGRASPALGHPKPPVSTCPGRLLTPGEL